MARVTNSFIESLIALNLNDLVSLKDATEPHLNLCMKVNASFFDFCVAAQVFTCTVERTI